ncbi:SusC/RagA family TonB-linked outer membrane protein [Chitinophagaceae bacterium 26-R-25]|nr:SusC/RagA family TonB-linked outer membrane protein [Chitinophagaceae bacterium 26-R-25]
MSVKNAAMVDVLQQVKEKSGYRVLYNEKTLEGSKPVTVNLKAVTLQFALAEIFKGQPITYTINKNVIVIRRNTEVVPAAEGPKKAFEVIPVTGLVVGEKGEALPAATITIDNTAIRFTTDSRGSFNMTVPEDGTMIISYIGYETDTVAIMGQHNFQIKLKLSGNKLNEVMVSTGYQKLNKERTTGSFGKPDMEVFEARTGTMDVVSRLEGLVAGLTVIPGPNGIVNNNNRLGNGNTTQKSIIRGPSSVQLSSDPLYVVNGLPVADFSTINPNDIADITVLKDAAATAIWGARAANGVIVVTTKSGSRNNKMKIGYSGFVNFMGKPDFDYGKMLSSQQYIQVAKETFNPTQFPYFTLGTAYVTPHEQILYNQYASKITEAEANKSLDSLSAINNAAQIKDLLYRNAITTSHTLSLSGGTQHYTYYTAISNTDIIGNRPGQNENAFRVNLNQELNINKALSISLYTNLNNTLRSSTRQPDVSNLFVPYQLFRDNQGNNLNMNWAQGLSPETRADYQARSRINLDYNPMNEINYGFTKTNNLAINVTGGITLKLFKGLSFQGTYGYQKAPGQTKSYDDSKEYLVRKDLLNFTVAPSTTTAPIYYLPTTGGTYQVTNNDQRGWTLRNQLVYNTFIRKGKDRLNVQFGQEARELVNSGSMTRLRGYDLDLLTYPPLDYKTLNNGIFGTVTSFRSALQELPSMSVEETSRFSSYFSLASYTFNDKYSVDASWRVDHSNLIGSDVSAQNKPVYSVGAKWNIQKERFLSSNQWIDNLALRATYGVTGNSPYVGAAALNDVLVVENNFMTTPVAGTGVIINSPANTKLAWETTKTINIGLDFAVLKSRLSGSIEFYNKNTTNLLGNISPNPLNGFQSAKGNLGELSNKGIEMALRSVNIQGKDFAWTSSLTFSYNKSKLLSYQNVPSFLNTALGKVGSEYMVGYSMASLFAYNYAGLDNKGNPQIRLAKGTVTADPSIAMPEDVIYKGTVIPVYNGGFTNVFRYKAFSLTANMIYSLGNVMRKDINTVFSGRITGGSTGIFSGNLNSYFLDRWQKPGEEAYTDIPAYIPDENPFTSTRNLDYYRFASTNIVSASYIKLRDITLSYQLPESLLNKAKISSVNFYVQASNFMVWKANKADIDPEYQNFTSGYRSIPPYKHAFSFGTNINF